MYRTEHTTLSELWKSQETGFKSLNALRARARGGVLAFIENNGPTQLFDRQLSLVRAKAALKCKQPGVTWRRIHMAMRALDKQTINDRLVSRLKAGHSLQEEVGYLAEQLADELK